MIRHVQDYGSIILIDERFAYGNIRNSLSKWLREKVVVHNTFNDMKVELQKFYFAMGERKFVPKVEQLQ